MIVPVYNIREYVGRCLESILAQTYSRLEILAIDDGSTDGSGKICDDFAKRDMRVRVIHQKNHGLAAARNKGLDNAKGEFIAFVDGDDYVRPFYIEKMYRKIWDTRMGIAICGYEEISEDGVARKFVPREEELAEGEAAVRLFLEQENMEIVAWNKLYGRRLFELSGMRYPDGEKYEDTLFTYMPLSLAERVSYVSEALYIYSRRGGSIMGHGKILERLKARERAADEAIYYCANEQKLLTAAEISMLTAKYAFVDAAIRGEIKWKKAAPAKKWIREQARNFNRAKTTPAKLKFYNFLMLVGNGGLYTVFRKMIH